MTRQQVKQLEFNEPMPIVMDGKLKRNEETFISPNGNKTEQEAQQQLIKIQEIHLEAAGWHTLPGHEGVFQDETDGLWYAFRHQAQYYG